MTAYLLDENVLRELTPRGNANVRKWISTVDDSDLRLSAAALKCSSKDTKRANAILNGIATLEKVYHDRIISIDAEVVAEWTLMLGGKNKDRWELALAATARVHGLILVTRNLKDFKTRDVRLLNPFDDPPMLIGV